VLLTYPKVPGTIAITYDDGPSEFSTKLLDIFDEYNGKATFFVNGNNKGRGMIDDPSTGWPAIIQRMYKQGHQVASHTWSHQSLDTINGQQRQAQMVYNEIALGKILGRYPTYMRPPYSQCASECQALMADLGYHVINFDVDIEDAIKNPDLQASINDFSGNLTNKSDPRSNNMLVIGHETSPDTVNKITEMMLKSISSKGFKAVTVGECLDDPKSNWYRHMDGTLDPAPPPQPKTPLNRPSVSTSPVTKAASVSMQLAATSFAITAFATKKPDSSIPIAQSAESDSVSQTHPANAIKPSSLSLPATNLSSSTSANKAGAAKSLSPATALLGNRVSFFVIVLVGIMVNCVSQTR
jgi:peptidoglycan/xylan/chitin deacetylase (PgdA/CDA1 family)